MLLQHKLEKVLIVATKINQDISCEFGGSFGLALNDLINRKVNDLDIFLYNDDISYFTNKVSNYKVFYDYLSEDSEDKNVKDIHNQNIEEETVKSIWDVTGNDKKVLFYQFELDGVKLDVWVNQPECHVVKPIYEQWFKIRKPEEAIQAKLWYIRDFIKNPTDSKKSSMIKHWNDLEYYFIKSPNRVENKLKAIFNILNS